MVLCDMIGGIEVESFAWGGAVEKDLLDGCLAAPTCDGGIDMSEGFMEIASMGGRTCACLGGGF